MTGDLTINSIDAWDEWGVAMDKGFIQALDTPAPMKDYQKNVSRAENGSRYVVASPYLAERDVTLGFTILGTSTDDYNAKKAAFMAVLQAGNVTIQTPALEGVFRLIYTGKSTSYTLSRSRLVGTIKAKFVEPDPTDRKEAKA